MEKKPNKIKGNHFRKKGTQWIAKDKEYVWHIPKHLRCKEIKKGDIVLVEAKSEIKRVLVIDVFREEQEEVPIKPKMVKSVI